MISEKTIALVRDSFARLDPNGTAAAAMFYARLFSIAPDLRVQFGSIDLFRQSRKLWGMLKVIVDLLDQPDHLMPAAAALGQSHNRYGVAPADFSQVRDALLWTLSEGEALDWTIDLHCAWAEAYDALSAVMIEAMAHREAETAPVAAAIGEDGPGAGN